VTAIKKPPPIVYRLDELAEVCTELGIESCRVDEDRLDVLIRPDWALAFCNLLETQDTLVGFDGTPWHAHGIVHFGCGSNSYIKLDELEIVLGLSCGELLVVSSHTNGVVTDRWLTHRDEPLSLKYAQPGEELTVFRLPEPSAPE